MDGGTEPYPPRHRLARQLASSPAPPLVLSRSAPPLPGLPMAHQPWALAHLAPSAPLPLFPTPPPLPLLPTAHQPWTEGFLQSDIDFFLPRIRLLWLSYLPRRRRVWPLFTAPLSPFASSSQSTPHMRMENLDLNSQVDSFPHLDIFPNQEQLQTDGARDGHGLPPLRPGGKRSRSHFNPPRPSGSRSRSGAGSGGEQSQSVRRSLPLGGTGGVGRKGRVPIRVEDDEDHVDDNEEDDDNDFDARFQSVHEASTDNEDDSDDDSSDSASSEKDDSSGSESSDDEDAIVEEYFLRAQKRRRQMVLTASMIGMIDVDKYMNKAEYRVPKESGYEWVMRSLGNRTACYNMFRMHRNVFDKLYNVLVESYRLKSIRRMSSVEALAMFLWICGGPQAVRQAENRFTRSLETISRKFDKVPASVSKLAADIIRPIDPHFRTVHQRLQSPRFSPFFDRCIGAIDGTHVPVVVPTNQVVQRTGRHNYTTQNVLAICDFNMRFTFVVAG